MDENDYLAQSQFGFHPGQNETTQAITRALHHIQKAKQNTIRAQLQLFLHLKNVFNTVGQID